jgi:hypothetical protein
MMRAMTTEHNTQVSIECGSERTPEEAAEIRAGLQRYTADCVRLSERHDELLAQYGDQWVAMHDGALFAATELQVLLGELRALGVNPGHAAVEFLHRVPPLHFHLR